MRAARTNRRHRGVRSRGEPSGDGRLPAAVTALLAIAGRYTALGRPRLFVGRLGEARKGGLEGLGMADKHLNLFYTYNRDTELIENNLTRAFVVFLSLLSGDARHRILSTLLKGSRKITDDDANVEDLRFEDARFALQSNIERRLPRNAANKVLLTVSTEPLDTVARATMTDAGIAGEGGSRGSPRSVPDAWVYDEDQDYCILVEVKVGSYPLDIGQLKAHAHDWFGLNLQVNRSLRGLGSRNSLRSTTWVDVLKTLRDASNDHTRIGPSEGGLLSHITEFIGYYRYRIFDGFDFGGLGAPPRLVIGPSSQPEREALGLSARRLGPPPGFALACQPFGP